MANNKNLGQAKKAKKDEFYTQLSDIEWELRHYKEQFCDKIVLCNCDVPCISNFFRNFTLNFDYLGLKRLITICNKSCEINLFSKKEGEMAVYLIYGEHTTPANCECLCSKCNRNKSNSILLTNKN